MPLSEAAPKQLDPFPKRTWTGLAPDAYFRTRFPFDARRETVWQEVCRYLQRRYIRPESRILDLGAAYCDFINNIVGREKHALDVSNIIRQYAGAGVHTHIGSSTDMTFAGDSYFDVIFASNLIEHLTREESLLTLAEVWRTLRAGGKLLVLQPNFAYCPKQYFDDYTHLQVFTHQSLSDLLEACGFSILTVKRRFLPVNMKSTLKLRMPFLRHAVRLYLVFPVKPLARQMLVVAQKPSDDHEKGAAEAGYVTRTTSHSEAEQ